MDRSENATARVYLDLVRARERERAPGRTHGPNPSPDPVPTTGVELVEAGQETVEERNLAAFRDRLHGVQGPDVVLDLRQVRFMDSSGLGVVLSALRRFQTAGGDLKLCALTPPVRRLLEVCRLHEVMEILDTRDQTFRAFTD